MRRRPLAALRRSTGSTSPRWWALARRAESRVQDLDHITRLPDRKPALRAAVVSHIAASWREIPHIHIGGELDGSGLAAAKRTAPEGVTVTDLLLLAVVRALRAVPELNGTIGKVSQSVHLALAVATPSGVVAPADPRTQSDSPCPRSRANARGWSRRRARVLPIRDLLTGGTITLSNLGAYPVDFFAPVVIGSANRDGRNRATCRAPVVIDGAVATGHRIWTNVAIDHRAGDGIVGARFLAAFERCMNELSS